jgi:hypothetical protein
VRERAGLKTRFERLRARGFLTAREIAQQIGVCVEHAYNLGRAGVLPVQHYGKGQRILFAPVNGAMFVRGHGGRYQPTQPRLMVANEHARSNVARRR